MWYMNRAHSCRSADIGKTLPKFFLLKLAAQGGHFETIRDLFQVAQENIESRHDGTGNHYRGLKALQFVWQQLGVVMTVAFMETQA